MAEKNLLSTFGDFLVEIGRGISNTTEGIIDAHIAPVAWVGGLFDKDFKKRASETIAYNWTDDHIKKWGWDKVREKSYASTWRGGGETARGIAEGVGAMLPSLALSAIPYAGPALSQASMSMGAGGKNMEQAINEGANFDNAFLYGIVSGSLEAGIERLGGHVMGGGTSINGKKLAGTSLGKFTSKGVGKMLEVGVSEAGEEVLGSYIDPFVKAGTGVDADIGANLSEAIQNTGKTALTGAAVGSILHGAGTGVRNISNTVSKRGGAKATRADNFLTSFTELGENYSADEKQNAKTLKAQNEYLRSMSQEIQGMDKTSRENYLKSSPLKQVFNAEDGTLKLDLVRENTNNDAVSSSIKAYSGTFEHAPVTNEEVIGEGARATKGYIEQILGKKARVIITSEYSDNTNASFSISEGVFYVNNNATELSKEQVAKQVAIHEIVHYTEGTEQYYEMVDELAKVVEDSNAPVEVKKRIGDLSKRLEAIKKDYQGDTEGMNEALKQYVYQTEGVADLVGDLLADEQTITRLAQRNESFVKKLLTKIKALANKSAKVDSEATKYLNKLVKSFEKAIDNAHGGVSLNSIGSADEEKEGKIQNVRFSRMNTKTFNENVDDVLNMSDEEALRRQSEENYVSIMHGTPAVILENVSNAENLEVIIRFDALYLATRKSGALQGHYHNLGEQMKQLPSLIANPDAIVKMDNGRLNLFAEMKTEKGNNGIISIELSTVKDINSKYQKYNLVISAFSAKDGYVRNIITNRGKEVLYKKEDLSQVNRQLYEWLAIVNDKSSTSIIPENGENVNRDERKSVQRSYNPSNEVDSEGSSLSEAQAEFFKDSKVRDKNGNLLVVYHGTEMQFNVYKSNSGYEEYFFTDNLNAAKDYGSKVKKQYLNLTNPFIVDFDGRYDKEIFDSIDYAKQNNYDGVIALNTYDGANLHNQYVAFEKNQIKNINNINPTKNIDIRYSKKRSYTPEHQIEKYQKELDNWDRETAGFSFVIGEATEIISNIEIGGSKIGNKQIRIDATKVKKILSEHQTMSIEVIKELPYLINDPILILDSLTQKGRIILLGEVYDEAGMPVMLILEPNPKTKNKKSTYVNVIKVASAYGKGKLQSLIERSNIKYASKNKSRANNWLKVNRLQLPLPNTQYGSATNSIDQNSEKINTFDENNLDERKSKKRSYNPTENADFEDEGNVWVEDEQDGVKVILSTPDLKHEKAPKTKKKSQYTPKKSVRDLIDDVVDAYVSIEGADGELVFISKEAKKEVITSIWKIVNNSNAKYDKKKFASLMADKILENIILADSKIYETDKLLKSFMHRIDLSSVADLIDNDIRRKINARWALKEGQAAISINEVVQEINTKVGIQISAQVLLGAITEINSLYEFYKKYISEEAGDLLKDKLGEKVYLQKRDKIAKDLESAFESMQTENELANKLAYVIDNSQKELEKYREYRKEFKYDDKRARAEGVIAYAASEIKKIKHHKYLKAQQPRFEEFKSIMQKIGKLMVRGNINLSSTREIMKELGDWYTDKNELIEDVYSDEMAKIPQFFRNIERTEQELSITELRQIGTFLTHVKNIFQNWGKIYRAGKWIDIVDAAKKEYDIISTNLDNLSVHQKLLIKNNMYFHTPETVAKNADGYDKNGEFTLLVSDLKHGELMREYEFTELAKRLDSFLEEKENKSYFKKVMDGKIMVSCGMKVDIRSLTVTPVEIPLTVFADLYLTVKAGDKDAIATIETGNASIQLDNEKMLTYLHDTPKEQILNAYEKLPEPAKKLIEFVSKWYNTEGTQIKYEQDLRKNGVSNLISGEYYPQHRLHYEGYDIERLFKSKGIGNHSFNRERIKGARSTLVFQNCFTKFLNHAYELYTYKHLDLVKDNYNKIIQANISDDIKKFKSIKMLISQEGFYHGVFDRKRDITDYFTQLITDVYGADTQSSVFNKVAGMVRGATATALLGANLKVIFTQASANIAVLGEIDFRSWLRIWRPSNFIKAVFNKARGVKSDAQKYSKWAEARAYSQGAIKASTIRDKVNKFSNILMKGVEIADALNVDTLFTALEREVKTKYGFAIGTEENKIKAGEMLDEIGMRTQQNQYASTRPAIVRDKNELAKGFATFKTDSTMFVSNLFSSFTEWATLNKKIKKAQESGNSKLIEELVQQRNVARRKSIKYINSLILMCAYMALLGRLFRKLYHQDENDEATLKDFGMDMLMSFNGMMPIISEISSYIFEGYEVDNLFYSSVNNMLSSVKKTLDAFANLINGKEITSQQWATLVRNDIYSIGQMFGVPVKNLYKNAKAVIGIIDAPTEYKIEAIFENKSSTEIQKNLKESIEKGDSKGKAIYLDLMYQNRDIEITDAVLKREMDRLIDKNLTKERDDNTNYSPFGSKIPDTITFNGEEIELTSKQTNGFKTAYKSAEAYSAKAVKTAMYKGLDDESKAYAIRKVYEYYHQSALEDVTGEKAKLVYFGSFIGIDKLALIIAYAKNVKGDSSGTRKEKIELYIKKFGLTKSQASLALRYLGYTDKAMDSQVQNLIKARGSLTKEQKEEFLGYI